MRVRRIGGTLVALGGVAILLALGVGWSVLIVAAVVLVGLGLAILSLTGPGPLPDWSRLAGLRLSALGLAAFTVAALGLDYLHPAAGPAGEALIVAILLSIVLTGVGSVLIGAAAVRLIWGQRVEGQRVRRISRGALALLAATTLLGVTGYTAYVGAIGSDQLAHPAGNQDCRTPLVRYGWTYQGVNYDIADDGVLQRQNPDMEHCASQGATAGNQVVTSDGVPIGGWYIPAGDGTGPAGPTVVLVHGWGANKSEVLKYAVPLHARFNVVAFDERDGGRSGRADSTFGLRERYDVEAIIDWLEKTKHPAHIALMGNSMGGGAAARAAAVDPRIEALILDSTHAHVSNILERRLVVDAGHPALPGTPAILAGIWVRTGLDLTEADPIAAVSALRHRPLLLIHGGADVHDLPAVSVDAIYARALDSGVPVERHICPGATHGMVIDTCPAEWGQWVVAFLNRAFQLPG